jgi:hypothetical protein
VADATEGASSKGSEEAPAAKNVRRLIQLSSFVLDIRSEPMPLRHRLEDKENLAEQRNIET